MKILFDNGTRAPIPGSLVGHSVTRAPQIGWEALKNVDLIQQAEAAGYDLLLSTDKNLKYQQNLKGRNIALVVLGKSAMAGCAALLGSDRDRGQHSHAGQLHRS